MMPIGFIADMENIAPNRMKERYGIHYANTFLKRTLGLMFKKDFQGELVFTYTKPTNLFIHTLFMKFDIDVKIYGEGNKLIRLIKKFAPYRCVFAKSVKQIIEKKSA